MRMSKLLWNILVARMIILFQSRERSMEMSKSTSFLKFEAIIPQFYLLRKGVFPLWEGTRETVGGESSKIEGVFFARSSLRNVWRGRNP